MSETEDYLPEDPATFDMDGWLSTGTVVRREVPAWADQVAARRAQEIDARLTELGVGTAPEGDVPLDAEDENVEEIEALTAEAAEVTDRLAASKVVFTVRGITDDEIEAVIKEHPAPRLPMGAPAKASPEQQQKALDRLARYTAAKAEVDAERLLHQIALCVETVTTPTGTAHGVTTDGLRRLKGEAFGGHLLERLWGAIVAARAEAVPVPGFTSPASSTVAPS